MGASSEFLEKGLIGVIEDPFGAALCLFLAGLLVARPLYKLNILTFNDYFKMRFGKAAEITSAIFMVPSYFGWIAAQIVALAIIFEVVCGMDRPWGVAICTLLVLFYTYVGGMWSVAITDFVQTLAIVTGLSILAVDMVMQVGGFGKMLEAAPVGTFRFFPEAKPVHIIHWVAAWMTLGLGSIPQQDIFQRVMAAKSERSSVNACYTSAFMYLTVAFIPIIIAFCGRILYPDMAQQDAQMMLPHMVLQHNSLGLQVLFFGALISAILSTCSGAMLAPATVIGENLVRPLYKAVTDAQLLRIMRLSLVGVALVTALMALSRDNIYELVSESSALSLVSLFVPLLGGLYWKKASAGGAVLSMIAGMTVWLWCRWQLPAPSDEAMEQMAGFWPTVKAVPAMLWGFAASILGMLVGTWSWPNREAL